MVDDQGILSDLLDASDECNILYVRSKKVKTPTESQDTPEFPEKKIRTSRTGTSKTRTKQSPVKASAMYQNIQPMDILSSNVINVYLFDWGDTLMVDFPGTPGKMCDWEIVEAVTSVGCGTRANYVDLTHYMQIHGNTPLMRPILIGSQHVK